MSGPQQRQEEELEGINFFIPMVDLMVAVLFVFIIIIMVLVLLIREETASAIEEKNIAVPKVPDELIVNRSPVEQFVEDITRSTLKSNGLDIKLDANTNTMRTVVTPPDANRIFSDFK